jgi:proteic killer suppression protein
VIKTFRCEETERLFHRQRTGRFRNVKRVALWKLMMLDAAVELRDLARPPGNRLEALHGSREGQYSIRINDRRRICFNWQDGDAYNVELVGYH